MIGPRIIIAKLGLDGHDRGAKIVARMFRDAGYEVMYTGLRQTPAMVATAALQEDAELVGVSLLSGAHNTLVPELLRLLKENGSDAVVLLGGIIPAADRPALLDAGVAAIFEPGEQTESILAATRAALDGTSVGA
ncbi:MAG: cobalamin B12-binding domain protein [Frankiales bacterium]|nr:cobalamin B12-binding domain protein [Frankiales bacterium]